MLEKLKQYKELIAIIVFFLGGFIWLDNQFPSKDDLKAQVAYLDCQLDMYMTLTQKQIHSQELAKQAQDLAARISEMGNNNDDLQISPAMKFELDQLKSDFAHNKEQHRLNNVEIDKILDELGRNVCKKVNS